MTDEAAWQYQDVDPEPTGPRTSRLAIASLPLSLLSIGGCCVAQPIVAFVAPLIALVATVRVVASPRLKGMAWSIGGLLLGLLFAVISIPISMFAQKIQQGPAPIFEAVAAGSTADFRGAFAGSPGTDGEASAFMAELESRYGAFVEVRPDEQAMSGGGFQQPPPGSTSFPVPYLIEFENATVEAELEIVIFDEVNGQPVFFEPKSIVLFDAERGDLYWPPSSRPAPTVPAGDDAASGEDDASGEGDGGEDAGASGGGS